MWHGHAHSTERLVVEEEQRGGNVCSIRETSHGRRLAMCSRDVENGDGEGISRMAYARYEGLVAEDAGAGISGAELQQYHNEASAWTDARRKA